MRRFQDSLRLTAMTFAILIGAALFSLLPQHRRRPVARRPCWRDGWKGHLLLTLVGGPDVATAQARLALLGLLVLIILLGFVLEFIEIIVILLPLTLPLVFAVLSEHLDPVWAAVLIAMSKPQTSSSPCPLASPCFTSAPQPNAFSLGRFTRAAPFVAVQLLVLALVWLLPGIVVGLQ